MHFPKYWAWGRYDVPDFNGQPGVFHAFGWSDVSEEEARLLGAERAARIATKLLTDDGFDFYGAYPESRPMREKVLNELPGGTAVVSRNSYGVEVLNTAHMAFVDIDFPEELFGSQAPVQSWSSNFLAMFGGGGKKTMGPSLEEKIAKAKEGYLLKLQNWLAKSPGDSFLLYETARGMRYILISRRLDPASPECATMLQELGSDADYRRLCGLQKSFRARLSPKPWRCDMFVPPKWPFFDRHSEKSYERWEMKYYETIPDFATCKYVGAVGDAPLLPEFEPLIALHDERTKATSGLKLA